MRKGQGSLEYLLILAAILAIAVVVVVVAYSMLVPGEDAAAIAEDSYNNALVGVNLVGYDSLASGDPASVPDALEYKGVTYTALKDYEADETYVPKTAKKISKLGKDKYDVYFDSATDRFYVMTDDGVVVFTTMEEGVPADITENLVSAEQEEDAKAEDAPKEEKKEEVKKEEAQEEEQEEEQEVPSLAVPQQEEEQAPLNTIYVAYGSKFFLNDSHTKAVIGNYVGENKVEVLFQDVYKSSSPGVGGKVAYKLDSVQKNTSIGDFELADEEAVWIVEASKDEQNNSEAKFKVVKAKKKPYDTKFSMHNQSNYLVFASNDSSSLWIVFDKVEKSYSPGVASKAHFYLGNKKKKRSISLAEKLSFANIEVEVNSLSSNDIVSSVELTVHSGQEAQQTPSIPSIDTIKIKASGVYKLDQIVYPDKENATNKVEVQDSANKLETYFTEGEATLGFPLSVGEYFVVNNMLVTYASRDISPDNQFSKDSISVTLQEYSKPSLKFTPNKILDGAVACFKNKLVNGKYISFMVMIKNSTNDAKFRKHVTSTECGIWPGEALVVPLTNVNKGDLVVNNGGGYVKPLRLRSGDYFSAGETKIKFQSFDADPDSSFTTSSISATLDTEGFENAAHFYPDNVFDQAVACFNDKNIGGKKVDFVMMIKNSTNDAKLKEHITSTGCGVFDKDIVSLPTGDLSKGDIFVRTNKVLRPQIIKTGRHFVSGDEVIKFQSFDADPDSNYKTTSVSVSLQPYGEDASTFEPGYIVQNAVACFNNIIVAGKTVNFAMAIKNHTTDTQFFKNIRTLKCGVFDDEAALIVFADDIRKGDIVVDTNNNGRIDKKLWLKTKSGARFRVQGGFGKAAHVLFEEASKSTAGKLKVYSSSRGGMYTDYTSFTSGNVQDGILVDTRNQNSDSALTNWGTNVSSTTLKTTLLYPKTKL